MRIKIGDLWFEPLPNIPIQIELSPKDRLNIANMAPDATRYAVFHADDKRNTVQKLAWMDAGAKDAVEKPRPRRSRNGKGSDNPSRGHQPLEKKP